MKIEFGEWDSDLQIPRQKLGEIHEYFVTTVIPTFEKFISKRSRYYRTEAYSGTRGLSEVDSCRVQAVQMVTED